MDLKKLVFRLYVAFFYKKCKYFDELCTNLLQICVTFCKSSEMPKRFLKQSMTILPNVLFCRGPFDKKNEHIFPFV